MVVEVVTEGLDVRDVFVAALGSQVTGEKDWMQLATHDASRWSVGCHTKRDIAHFSFTSVLDTGNALQL